MVRKLLDSGMSNQQRLAQYLDALNVNMMLTGQNITNMKEKRTSRTNTKYTWKMAVKLVDVCTGWSKKTRPLCLTAHIFKTYEPICVIFGRL